MYDTRELDKRAKQEVFKPNSNTHTDNLKREGSVFQVRDWNIAYTAVLVRFMCEMRR